MALLPTLFFPPCALEREVIRVVGEQDHHLSVVIVLGDHLTDQPLLKRKKHGWSVSWLSLDGK